MRSKFKWIFTLVLALSMQFSFAQEKTVTGVVSDATGPLPGANVVIKGTTTGVQTDVDGKYAIKAKAGDVLVFSFIGMTDTTAKVGASNTVNVKMQEEGVKLTEVIVGAMGIKKRPDALTSSTQVVNNKELTQASNPNIVQSLTGKVSGLQINKTSNGVNGGNKIVLRGSRSMTGNNEALVVIDGAISTSAVLGQLPPESVENVNVIKGAQGGALYGEQGVNGVIIVTTSKGKKAGKTTVSVNSAVDFESIAFLAEHQQVYGQGWDGVHYANENGGWGLPFDGVIRDTGMPQADGTSFQVPYSPIKNNIEDFFNTGTTYQNGFSINSGDDTSYAIISASKVKTQFVVEGDRLERNSFIFKGGKKIGKLSLDGSVNYIAQKSSETSSNLLDDLMQAAANVPVTRFRNSGNDGHWTVYAYNPYWIIDNNRNDARRTFINGVATLNYEINKNINVNYIGNIQVTGTNFQSHINQYDQAPGPLAMYDNGGVTSEYRANQSSTRRFYGDLMINLDYMLTDNLNLKANIGNNVQDHSFRITSQGGTNLEVPGFYHISNVLNPDVPGTLDNRYEKSNRASVFANVDLAFKDYLFLNITGRNDWSSVLHPTNNSFFYPSAGVSWIPTKAFESLSGKVLNYVKIAASYVQVGNSSAVGTYKINPTVVSPTGYPFGDLSSYIIDRQPTDPFIKPEFVTTAEVNVNLGFFNNRLTFDFAAYESNTTDLITFATVSSPSGLTRAQSNVGDMKTTGLELDLGFIPIKTASFSWTARASYSTNKSIITALEGDAKEVNLSTLNYGYVGVFAEVGQEFPLIKGSTMVRDANGNVIIDAATGRPIKSTGNSILGKATPDYILGFSNTFDYKGLRLTAVLDYRTGHQIFSATKQNLFFPGHLPDSAEYDRSVGFIYPGSVVADPANPGSYVPNGSTPATTVISAGGYAEVNGAISYYRELGNIGESSVIDATALKVRELSLSYALPSKMLEKTGLSSVRLGINARNPFVLLAKDNKGYTDPESSDSAPNSRTGSFGNGQGISGNDQYPTTRTIGCSLNLTF